MTIIINTLIAIGLFIIFSRILFAMFGIIGFLIGPVSVIVAIIFLFYYYLT